MNSQSICKFNSRPNRKLVEEVEEHLQWTISSVTTTTTITLGRRILQFYYYFEF